MFALFVGFLEFGFLFCLCWVFSFSFLSALCFGKIGGNRNPTNQHKAQQRKG